MKNDKLSHDVNLKILPKRVLLTTGHENLCVKAANANLWKTPKNTIGKKLAIC
jgi:hypothetical protein